MGLLNEYYTKNKKVNPLQSSSGVSSSSGGGLLTQYQQKNKLKSPFDSVPIKKVATPKKVSTTKTTIKVTPKNKTFFEQFSDTANFLKEKVKVGTKAAIGSAQTGLGVIREQNISKLTDKQLKYSNNPSMQGKSKKQLQEENRKIIEGGRKKQIEAGKDREKIGKTTGFKWLAGEVAEATPQLISSLGLGVAASIVTKNPALGVSLGFSSSFSQTSGALYNDAKNYGVNDKKARDVAINGGVASALIEQLPLGKVLERLPAGQKIKQSILKEVVKSMVSQSATEAGTESIQQIIENAARRVYNKDQDLFEGVKESALIGGVLGGVTGGVTDTALGILASEDTDTAISKINKDTETAINTPEEDRTPRQNEIVKALSTQELTPKQAISLVANDPDMVNSIDGNAIIKTAMEAEKLGKNVILDLTKDNGEVEIDIVAKKNYVLGDDGLRNVEDSSSVNVGASSNDMNVSMGVSEASTNSVPSQDLNSISDAEIVSSKTLSPKRTSFLSEFSMTSPSQEDYSKYYKTMQAVEKDLFQGLRNITSEVGGEATYRLKTQESLTRKLLRKKKSLGEMNDTLGATIVVESKDDMPRVLETTKINLDVKKVDSYLNKPTFLGYRAIHLDVELENGAIVEVQLNTKQGLYQKHWAHEIYDKWRKYIEHNGVTTFDQVRTLIKETDPGKMKEFYDDVVLSRKIYNGEVEIPQKYIDEVNKNLKDTKDKLDGKEKAPDKEEYEIKDYRPQKKEQRVLNTKEVKAIKSIINDKLELMRQTAKTPEQLDNDIEDLYKYVIRRSNNDKVVLSALRTELSKEMFGLAGANTGDYKTDYKMLQVAMKEDPELGEILAKIEFYISELDEKLLSAQEPARVKPDIDTRIPPKSNATTPSKETPVGTGKSRESKLYKRVKEALGAEYEATKVTYNELSLEKQAEKVVDIIESDAKRALKIAKGIEEPPLGTTQNSFALGMFSVMVGKKDFQTAAELLTATSLRSTRLGQEIVSLRGAFNGDTPENAINRVVQERLERITDQYKGAINDLDIEKNATKAKKATKFIEKKAQELKTQLTKRQRQLKKADELFEMLKCS